MTFDAVHGVITIGGNKLPVTPSEFRLLSALAANAGGFVDSSDLWHTVWGMENTAVRNSLKVHLGRLRRKLAVVGSSFTVNGVRINGYVLAERNARQSLLDHFGTLSDSGFRLPISLDL